MKLRSLLIRIIFFLSGLIVFIGLALFLLAYAYKHEIGPFAPDLMHVADYPGAQQVHVTTAPDFQPHEAYKTVKFATSDSTARIFDFYKADLDHRFLEDWRTNSAEQSPGLLEIYGSSHQDSGPLLRFKVRTEQKDGLTYVTIERSYEPGL